MKHVDSWRQIVNTEGDTDDVPRDMAADIDDLSRDHAEEIEAHRLTRERAEAAERKLAELVSDVRAWWYDAPPCGKQLMRILDEYEGGEG